MVQNKKLNSSGSGTMMRFTKWDEDKGFLSLDDS
jgi:hypothetical protein